MPTGDENLINAVKQMGKAVKGKKDAAVSEETLTEAEKKKAKMNDEKVKQAREKSYPKPKPSGVYEEAEELDEAKKKKCKEGYKRDENGNCVKEKKSKTTIVYGGRWGYGGHHHDHDEDDDSNDNVS